MEVVATGYARQKMVDTIFKSINKILKVSNGKFEDDKIGVYDYRNLYLNIMIGEHNDTFEYREGYNGILVVPCYWEDSDYDEEYREYGGVRWYSKSLPIGELITVKDAREIEKFVYNFVSVISQDKSIPDTAFEIDY